MTKSFALALGATLFAAVFIALRVSTEASAAPPASRATMREFAKRLRQLEARVRADDDIGRQRAATSLLSAIARAREAGEFRSLQGDREVNDRLVASLVDLAGELAAADATDPERILEETRAACVSCHGLRRDADDCVYPSTTSIVSGTIRLRAKDGSKKDDASDVLVFIESKALNAKRWPLPRRAPYISQKHSRFQPTLLPIVVGTTVEFPNDDSIFHNAFSLSKAKHFDLAVSRPGDTGRVTFRQSGVVRVYCNIHPDMNASIVVLENPFFTITDRVGRFAIPEVPPGRYRLRVWNSLGAGSDTEVEVGEFDNVRVELDATETRISLKHKDKHGKTYRKKY